MPALRQSLAQLVVDALALSGRLPARRHRLPARRQLANDRHVQIAEHRQGDRARNRRRGHDEVVRIDAQPADAGPLMDAELVLLVDDHQAQPGELHVLLHQRLRADDQVDVAGGERGQGVASFGGVSAPVSSRRRTRLWAR